MTQYVKKTFEHAADACKFVETGGQLLQQINEGEFVHIDCPIEAVSLFFADEHFYTIKPTDWREHITDKILCLCQDDDVMGGDEFITTVIRYDSSDGTFLTSDGTWVESAKPLARSEIATLMENAPV